MNSRTKMERMVVNLVNVVQKKTVERTARQESEVGIYSQRSDEMLPTAKV